MRLSSVLDEINGANGESRLRREGREDLHRAITERIDLGSPHREHPDNVAVQQHRDTHDCPVAGNPLRIHQAIVRVCEHVRDLRSPPVKPDPAGERSPVQDHGVIGDEFPVLRRHPGAVGKPVPVPIHQEYLSGIGDAELPRRFDDRFKYSFEIRC